MGNDSGNILSPRSSEAGIGMKMVEYVLASTPNKMEALEPRMRNLVIVCIIRDNYLYYNVNGFFHWFFRVPTMVIL